MEKILKIKKIEKYYGSKSSLTKAIDKLSFEVEKGEFVAIMGAWAFWIGLMAFLCQPT